MPTMLYKCPGPHAIHGGQFDYTIVEDDQIDASLADGWKLTTPEAKQARDDAMVAQEAERARAAEADAAKADEAGAPTRAELEQAANELGIKFDGRTGDKKLGELIKAAAEAGAPESKV